jgi:hypothetical protein
MLSGACAWQGQVAQRHPHPEETASWFAGFRIILWITVLGSVRSTQGPCRHKKSCHGEQQVQSSLVGPVFRMWHTTNRNVRGPAAYHWCCVIQCALGSVQVTLVVTKLVMTMTNITL